MHGTHLLAGGIDLNNGLMHINRVFVRVTSRFDQLHNAQSQRFQSIEKTQPITCCVVCETRKKKVNFFLF
jgi:hypothetical protein